MPDYFIYEFDYAGSYYTFELIICTSLNEKQIIKMWHIEEHIIW